MAKKSKDTGRWTRESRFDGGGQADIHIVVDSLGEYPGTFALKKLRNPERTERFRREIAALRKLNGHPHIISLIDADDSDAPVWFVMRLGEGSLEKCAPAGGYSLEEAFRLFREICAGVAALHAEKVVHRDLKPDNVIMSGGTARVGDLGLCLIEDLRRITPDWEAVGPRYYMAPEAEAGRDDDADALMDIYSLGKILYWLLTGVILPRERLREAQYALPGARQHQALDEFTVVVEEAIAEKKRNRTTDVAHLLGDFEAAVRRFEARPERSLALKRSAAGVNLGYRDLPPLSSGERAAFAKLVLDDAIAIAPEDIWPVAADLEERHTALALRLLERLDDAAFAELIPAIADHYFGDAERARSFAWATLGWRDRDIRPAVIRHVIAGDDPKRLTLAVTILGNVNLRKHLDLGRTLRKIGPPVSWSKDLLVAAYMQDYPGRSADMRAIIEDAEGDPDRFMPAFEVLAKSEGLSPEEFTDELRAYVERYEDSPVFQARMAEIMTRNSQAEAEE